MSRNVSVDFFRGLTVVFMIIVNTPGHPDWVYPPLRHAIWHGLTFADLVFPSFLFIMGVSMWYSFDGDGRKWSRVLGWKVLRRTVLLGLLGVALNNFPFVWENWGTWRLPGVLQRLALGYGLAAVLVLNLNRKLLVMVSAGILLLYWFLLFFFAVPGLDPFGAEGSAVLRLDRWLFGTNHLYLEQVRPGVRIPFDPEGLLSTLPAVVTVLLGWFAGLLATGRARPMDLIARDLLLFGIIAVGGGLVWDLFFPINKKIWSSSYVVFSGGFSMILFGLSVWVLDVLRWRNGVVFFTSIGTNALFAFLMSELIIRVVRAVPVHGSVVVGVDNLYQWFYHYFFMWGEPNPLSSLSFALVYMLFCWVICWVLFNRKIVIKL